MAKNFLLYQKLYDLVLVLFPYNNRIPKSHRFVLGRYIEETAIDSLVLVVKANSARGKTRSALKEELSDSLAVLRILIRLLKDLKFISVKQYKFVSEKLVEVSCMVDAWK